MKLSLRNVKIEKSAVQIPVINGDTLISAVMSIGLVDPEENLSTQRFMSKKELSAIVSAPNQ